MPTVFNALFADAMMPIPVLPPELLIELLIPVMLFILPAVGGLIALLTVRSGRKKRAPQPPEPPQNQP